MRDEDAARALAVKAKLDLKTRWTTWAVVGGLAVGIGSLIAALIIITALITQRGGRATPSGTGRVGREAPDFTLRLFDGQTVSLSSLKGKPVLVNFWAST